MPAGPFCTSMDILTSWVQRVDGWLQVWCYSYRGVITSEMSADLVPLSDMPDYTVQLYQTCMLGSFIQIHVFGQLTFWLVECRGTRDGYKSGATLTEVPLHQTCLLIRCLLRHACLNSATLSCTVQLYQTCMLGSFIQSHLFVKCFSTRKSGMLQIHQTCLQVRCSSHRVVKRISYQPGRHLEYIKFWVMHQLHHWDVTRMMCVTPESVNSAFCTQIPGVCRFSENFLIIL